jgi:hypothetical protein
MSTWERVYIWWSKTLTKKGRRIIGFCAAVILLIILNWIF